jgi:hypothetical protein
MNLAIHIPEGETYAFYIASSNYNYIYYDFGTSVGNVAASDNNIQIKEGAASYFPFGSYPTSPIIWNGTVHYKAPGCASLRVPVVADIFSPQVLASASNSTICEGDTIQLTASNITPGDFTFEWSPAIAGMLPQDGIGQTVTVSPPVTMTFTVTVLNEAEGCDTAVAVNVTVNPSPAVYISGLQSQYYDTDAAVTLTGNPSGGTFAGPGISGNTFDPTSVGIGTYTITYTFTDANGCTGSINEQVSVVDFVGIAGISDHYDLSIYPNPTEGLFTLDLTLPEPAGEVIMRIYNMVGQPVFETVFGAAKDELKQTFDFSEWAAGSYFVQVAMDGKIAHRKLTIQK